MVKCGSVFGDINQKLVRCGADVADGTAHKKVMKEEGAGRVKLRRDYIGLESLGLRTNQKRKRISADQTCFNRSASVRDMAPSLRRRRLCSRQSKRERRTVDGTRNPAAAQFCKRTSDAERGGADVTTATTTSAPSSQSKRTGRSLEATPLVNGMSASQNSPAAGIVVNSLVFGREAAQESRSDRERSSSPSQALDKFPPFCHDGVAQPMQITFQSLPEEVAQ